jgi:hypothetical protein
MPATTGGNNTTEGKNMNTAQQYEAFSHAANSEQFSYARAKSWRASGHVQSNDDYIVYIYARVDGFSECIARISGLDQAARILDAANRPFPYSPTEKA